MMRTWFGRGVIVAVAMLPALAHGEDLPFQPSPELLEVASVGGKYQGLMRILPMQQAINFYGRYNDWGWWTVTQYQGYVNLPPGYWVWVEPNWYIWSTRTPQPVRFEGPPPQAEVVIEQPPNAAPDVFGELVGKRVRLTAEGEQQYAGRLARSTLHFLVLEDADNGRRVFVNKAKIIALEADEKKPLIRITPSRSAAKPQPRAEEGSRE